MSALEFLWRGRSEKLTGRAFFTAPCGQINPIELYSLEKGYLYKCRNCGQTATKKMLFLSPKHEAEGAFGPAYFCQSCVPDINQVAKSEKLYFKILYEGRKK